jgi:hypothetical protein
MLYLLTFIILMFQVIFFSFCPDGIDPNFDVVSPFCLQSFTFDQLSIQNSSQLLAQIRMCSGEHESE